MMDRLTRAKNSLKDFGLTLDDLENLAEFDGDVTCGQAPQLPENFAQNIRLALTDIKLGYLSAAQARLVSILENAHKL